MKRTLGWTVPKVRYADTADLWTWLIIAAHTQLRLARPLAEDLRRPWERPAEPRRLTPARVRRGFRHLRANTARLSHDFPARESRARFCGAGEEFAEVVNGAEELDLGVDGSASAVVEVSAESLEELGEARLDESAALAVLGLAGRGRQAVGHGLLACGGGLALRGESCLVSLAGHRDQ